MPTRIRGWLTGRAVLRRSPRAAHVKSHVATRGKIHPSGGAITLLLAKCQARRPHAFRAITQRARSPTIVGESSRSKKKEEGTVRFLLRSHALRGNGDHAKSGTGLKSFRLKILRVLRHPLKVVDCCRCDFLPWKRAADHRGGSANRSPFMWMSSFNADCGLPQSVRISGRRRLWKLTANTGSLFFPISL